MDLKNGRKLEEWKSACENASREPAKKCEGGKVSDGSDGSPSKVHSSTKGQPMSSAAISNKQQYTIHGRNDVRNSSLESISLAGHGHTGLLRARSYRRVFVNAARRNGGNGNLASRSRKSTTIATDVGSSELHSPVSSGNNKSPSHIPSEDEFEHQRESVVRSPQVPRSHTRVLPHSENKRIPLMYVAPTGNISLILHRDVIVEIAADRSFRVLWHNKFAAMSGSKGTVACLQHPAARIVQNNEKVFCGFGAVSDSKEKVAVLGPCGVLFTMSHLTKSYLLSSASDNHTTFVPFGRSWFPQLNYDSTLLHFYLDSECGEELFDACQEIAQQSRYRLRNDGSLSLTVNGIFIRQLANGDVEINSRPRHIYCSPSQGTIRVRTNVVDMAVEEDDKAYVRLGTKRVHVSRSGMVVSDANCITTMDHRGCIISFN